MKITAIVLDSLGLGYLPDAPRFGDEGADTLDHVVLKTGLQLPNFVALGLGQVPGVHTLPQVEHPLSADSPIPAPQGGGGTDFRPFFGAVNEIHQPHLGGVCVYLTDGYGDFPAESPELPTLWVVSPGGLDAEQFPFGEAMKLL